jgi:pyruvate, orthophosphate dikinase
MQLAVTKARMTRPDIETGVCGEQGGDPARMAPTRRDGVRG